jgi:predicted DNA-binding transcriptional regulator YafY
VKLSSSLPAVHRVAVERLRQRVHVDVTPWFHVREVVSHLPALRDAVLDDRELRLVYRRKDGRRLEENVKPYGLVAKAESWLQRARPGGDGAKVIDLDFEKETYAVSSLASLGRTVEVLAPPTLKARLLALGRELHGMYDGRRGRAAR